MRSLLGIALLVGCSSTPAPKNDTSETTDTAVGNTTTEPIVRGGDAIAFVPYTMGEGEVTLDHTVNSMGDGVMLPDPRAEVEVTSNLFVTVGLGELEPPLFADEVDWIGGVAAVDASRLPIELNGTVLDVWYMGPFDYHTDAGMGVRVVNTYGDLTDRTLELWVGDYESSTWMLAGTMTETKDSLTLDGSVSLVSTMVLMDTTGEMNPPEPAAIGSNETNVLTGTITGSAGGPLEGARVQFCRGTECTSSSTDASGVYRIEGLSSGPGSFEVIPN